MTATRGVRYLLRNGLDYLNYQQYERALKFLREAETRQKELNDAEKLALKQGIERAQRGLREAADAESPYALSERSRHRNGFNPAKPESQVASNTDPLNPPARKRKHKPIRPNQSPGERWRRPGRAHPARQRRGGFQRHAPLLKLMPAPARPRPQPCGPQSNQPASLPEIPKLPSVSQLPDPTDASVMPNQRGAAADQGAAGVEPVAAQENAMPRRAAAVAETSQSPVSTPAAGPAVEPPNVQTPDKELVLSPVPTGETPAPNMAATIPSPAPLATPAPSSSGLAQPSDASPTPKTAPNPTVIDLETISSPAPASGTAQPAAAGGLAHKESEEATPASMPNPAPDTSPAPTAAPNPGPAAPDAATSCADRPSSVVPRCPTPHRMPRRRRPPHSLPRRLRRLRQ